MLDQIREYNEQTILTNKIVKRNKIIVGTIILSIVILIHIFRIGSYLSGELFILYYSYASDFIIPFGYYFLLCIVDKTIFIEKWYLKFFIILGLTTFAEILQYFGVYTLGSTFDYYDILMYGTGAGLAVIFERFIFKAIFRYWDYE